LKCLNNSELKEITAGAIKWGLLGIIGGIVTFVIGVLDGITNPVKCRS
jgi:hypothetical protein